MMLYLVIVLDILWKKLIFMSELIVFVLLVIHLDYEMRLLLMCEEKVERNAKIAPILCISASLPSF